MPKKKTSTKKRKNTKKQSNPSIIVSGIILVALAIFAIFGLGFIGKQIANVYRFIFGDSYLFAAAVSGILGLVMVIYDKIPRFKASNLTGFFLTYLGVLIVLAHNFYYKINIHTNLMAGFLTNIGSEFSRANITSSVGGGIIGNGIYAILTPLLSGIGALIIAILLIIIGLMLLFNVEFKSVIHGFQQFGQWIIGGFQSFNQKSSAKYHEFVEDKRDQIAQNREDRLQKQEADVEFPDVQDFDQRNSKPEVVSEPVQETFEPVVEDFPIEMHDENVPSTSSNDSRHSIDENQQNTVTDVQFSSTPTNDDYQLPSINLLKPGKKIDQSKDKSIIQKNTKVLQETFKSFGVDVTVKKAVLGPTVTKYEIQPAVGVKVSKIVNLSDDLALALAAKDIRIEAPIPGKPLIGIEVPNQNTSPVAFRDVIEHQPADAKTHPLQVPLGKDVAGQIISADLSKMPHLLIAGSTGSGKSVAINTIITSILMKAKPDEVKLVLIDPKMVELSVYNGIPHLLIPVVTDAKLATNALNKVVKEMERRYELFAASGVRNMGEYNDRVAINNKDKNNPAMEKMPYIIVIVDELSDLMMVAGREVEAAIVRLAQMARAAGIHMILATQRPSVDVITGLIKANVPSRIAFAVSSGIDSRTILDSQGAEKLIGRGDMLFMPIGVNKPTRVQGAYISVEEVESVVDFVAKQQSASYDESMIPTDEPEENTESDQNGLDDADEYFDEAVSLVRKQQSASVSMLQRRFRIGYNRAARLIDDMEDRGIVGPSEGSKPRKVLLPPEE